MSMRISRSMSVILLATQLFLGGWSGLGWAQERALDRNIALYQQLFAKGLCSELFEVARGQSLATLEAERSRAETDIQQATQTFQAKAKEVRKKEAGRRAQENEEQAQGARRLNEEDNQHGRHAEGESGQNADRKEDLDRVGGIETALDELRPNRGPVLGFKAAAPGGPADTCQHVDELSLSRAASGGRDQAGVSGKPRIGHAVAHSNQAESDPEDEERQCTGADEDEQIHGSLFKSSG